MLGWIILVMPTQLIFGMIRCFCNIVRTWFSASFVNYWSLASLISLPWWKKLEIYVFVWALGCWKTYLAYWSLFDVYFSEHYTVSAFRFWNLGLGPLKDLASINSYVCLVIENIYVYEATVLPMNCVDVYVHILNSFLE